MKEQKTIMTVICKNGKVTLFDNEGYYFSKHLEGELYNYSSEFVVLYIKDKNELKVYDVNLVYIRTINLNSSNF